MYGPNTEFYATASTAIVSVSAKDDSEAFVSYAVFKKWMVRSCTEFKLGLYAIVR
jgi:hypothetical protein